MNISNHKKTILIIILTLVIFFVYWFFFLSKETVTNDTGLTSQSLSASNTQYDKEFVTSLLGLNSVNINTAIFESNVYKALTYPQVPFTVNYFRESGRENPFLPIGINPSNTQNVDNQNRQSTTTTNTNTVSPNPTTNTNSTTTNPRPSPTPRAF